MHVVSALTLSRDIVGGETDKKALKRSPHALNRSPDWRVPAIGLN
jgi:hypothetical protein